MLTAAHLDDAVLRSALDAIISIDAHGVVVEFNPAAERMFGVPRAEVVGADMADLIIPPEYRESHRGGLSRLLDGQGEQILERRVELIAQRADGSRLPVELAITRLSGERASAIYTGFIRDLTDHKRAESERYERIARQALVVALGQAALSGIEPPELTAQALATLVEGVGVQRGAALEMWDGDGLRREAAVGLGELAGHGEPAGEAQVKLLARTVEAGGSLLLRGVELAQLADSGLLLVQGMSSMLSVTLQGDDGGVGGMLAIAADEPEALRREDIGFAQAIAHVLGTAIARWRADQEITRLGLHDPLTGLANRPLFENRLEQALGRARRGEGEAGLLFVDLDGFAALNEGYGHRIGDEVLVGVGARLQGVLPAGTTCGRMAGDDFAVLVPDAGSDTELLDLAARIGLAVREPMLAGGRELSMSASIGVVQTQRGAGSAAELLRIAAAAAIRARERGGGRVELATPAMRRRLVHTAEIEQGLRRALTDGELRLHYQPILDLRSGEIVALEALVRWQHPDHGLLAPGQFLAAGDAAGLAVPLGAEILSIACRELAGWRDALGEDPRRPLPTVHVNISARHFAAPGLAGTVARTLQRSGLEPDKLVLEIAETMVAGEGHAAIAQLDELRGVGVRIALDRFGTGYSSLAAVRELPFDALKVDSSFLTELGQGTRDARLVEAMIGMGHSLGLPMTAAKVETAEQLRLLRALGLDRAQGELFAPPMSANSALELVRSGGAWSGLLEATRPQQPVPAALRETPAPVSVDVSSTPPTPPPPPMATLSLGQAAEALGISTTTARRWADDGRLLSTRTAGGHRRFAAGEIRRLLTERGRASVAPSSPPLRALPELARLVDAHGVQLAELSWRGLYGEVQAGFFVDHDGAVASELWLAALASAAETVNHEMLHEATAALMRAAQRAGAPLLERHLALERFAETAARALTRRSCPREEIVDLRRLFASLAQRQLADFG